MQLSGKIVSVKSIQPYNTNRHSVPTDVGSLPDVWPATHGVCVCVCVCTCFGCCVCATGAFILCKEWGEVNLYIKTENWVRSPSESWESTFQKAGCSWSYPHNSLWKHWFLLSDFSIVLNNFLNSVLSTLKHFSEFFVIGYISVSYLKSMSAWTTSFYLLNPQHLAQGLPWWPRW